jgi:hypothetical protein
VVSLLGGNASDLNKDGVLDACGVVRSVKSYCHMALRVDDELFLPESFEGGSTPWRGLSLASKHCGRRW